MRHVSFSVNIIIFINTKLLFEVKNGHLQLGGEYENLERLLIDDIFQKPIMTELYFPESEDQLPH